MELQRQETNKDKDEAKKDKPLTPKNGDKQRTAVAHKGVQGTVEKVYNNGVWSDVPGSFQPDPSFPNNTATPTRTLFTGADGTAYWVDPSNPGQVTRLDGIGGKYSLAPDRRRDLADEPGRARRASGWPRRTPPRRWSTTPRSTRTRTPAR